MNWKTYQHIDAIPGRTLLAIGNPVSENEQDVAYINEIHPDAEANAKLIAAAPEMLELLEEIKAETMLNADACDHELLSKIETVIKKTRG